MNKKEKKVHISHRNFGKINFIDIDDDGSFQLDFWKYDMENKLAELGMHFSDKQVEFLKEIGISDKTVYEMYQQGIYKDDSWWQFDEYKEQCHFYFVFILPETHEEDEYAPSPESIYHLNQCKIFA